VYIRVYTTVHYQARARESVTMRATAAVFEKLFTPLSVAEVEVDSPGPRGGSPMTG
jgi:hypothetical protein